MIYTAYFVKAIRQQLDLTQEELSQRLNVSESQVSDVENGYDDLPSAKLLGLLAAADWEIKPPPFRISRDKMAELVAAHTSGFADALAEQADYDVADEVIQLINLRKEER